MTTLGFDDPQSLRRFWVGIFLDVAEQPDEETITAIRVTRPVEELLDALREDNRTVRTRASQMLWALWIAEAGGSAEREIGRGVKQMEDRKFEEARERFSRLIEKHPDFAEARNKRATVRFLEGDYEGSAEDCLATLRLNPQHFGAWHGLGLCYMRLGNYGHAATAFQCAAHIQPLEEENHRLAAYCRGKAAKRETGRSRGG